jgi:D-3-phosphoglycerate dehydrogenase / 2-oxoglutarate reductase
MSDATGPFRVLIADAIAETGLAPMATDPRFELVTRTGLKGEALADAIAGCDAVIVRSSTQITEAALAQADRLKVVGRAGVGVDNIDVAACTERGVAVMNARAGNTISAAELTFALLLAAVRRIPAADASMRAGEWDRKRFTGAELYGKTLGLVGVGRIGGEVARRARAFGMDVVAYDPYVTEDRATQLDVRLQPLDAVIAGADVLSLHVPLTDATAGLIGAAQLARMRPGAIIVNAARGGVLDEAALLAALDAGTIAGAALDVFAEEPLPADHPLRAHPRLVLTPHLGAATAEAQQNVALEIAGAVRTALLEGDFSTAVNAPAVGSDEMRRVRPLLELTTRLGRLAHALAGAPTASIEVRYAGPFDDAIRPLVVGALIGVLEGVVGRGAVNFVNALHLAERRGIAVTRAKTAPRSDYAEYVEVRLRAAGTTTVVAGALLAEGHPRIVGIDGFRVSVRSRGGLLVLRNRDVPGVIGRVGTVLGEASVNIAEYHQARMRPGGDALAAVSMDGECDAGVVTQLAALPDVIMVRQVLLD